MRVQNRDLLVDFKDLLEYCQVEAIANRVKPTEASVYRALCRTYSEKFHTALPLVLEMDPEHVILNVYEAQAEDMDIEDYQKLEHVLDTIRSIEDPDYDAKRKAEQEEFDRLAEEEDELRRKSGKALHPSLQRKLDEKRRIENGEEPAPQKPTGGSINLDYLSKQDSEG